MFEHMFTEILIYAGGVVPNFEGMLGTRVNMSSLIQNVLILDRSLDDILDVRLSFQQNTRCPEDLLSKSDFLENNVVVSHDSKTRNMHLVHKQTHYLFLAPIQYQARMTFRRLCAVIDVRIGAEM